jgi:FAD/FMN-containing dehydrogenase
VSSAPASPPPPPRVLRDLGEVVGPANVLTDPELIASHTTDWTGRFVGHSPAVVRAGTAAEVAGVVALCRSEELALTLQGGNTGLVGGGVPLRGEVVLSLRRLDEVGAVDAVTGQVTAGAGATVAAVQEAARAGGWEYGVDLASRDSATVGGTVATNAGGLHVLRYGDTRAQVLGVEAVFGTGAVVSHLGGLVKDNTGYSLPALLCGSEGTLGVVTAARLRLVAPTPSTVVALVAFDAVEPAVGAAGEVRRTVPSLSAAELFFAEGVELVREVAGLPAPFDRLHRAYLLLEAAAQEDPTDALSDAVDTLNGVVDVAVAASAGRRRELWAYREAHPPAVNTLGPPHKLDVTLPAASLGEFVARAPAVVSAVAPSARTWLWGHAADGNIHVNVTGVAPDDEAVDEAVFSEVARLGGSISAEHGIGTAKRRWLQLNRSADEIASFRAIKKALDPDGVLNPEVLFEPV